MSVQRSLIGVALLATILVLATFDHSTRAVTSAAEKKKEASPAAEREKPGDANAQKSPPRRCGKEAIEKALDERTELKFVEKPLQDVADYFSGKHRINIVLGRRGLEEVGIGTDTPITWSLSGVTLRQALDLILHDLELTWFIQDDVVLITTREEAERMVYTEVYDVADLVTVRDSKGEVWEDYDALTDMITCTIHPTTWDEAGGPGSIVGGRFGTAKVLVISQTYGTHRQIVDLLEKIRSVAKKNGANQEPPRRNKASARVDPRGFGTGGFGGGGVGFGAKPERDDAPATDADCSGKAQRTQTKVDSKGGGFF